jgi:L-amino acid N-acyltransferase YncA
MGVSSQVVTITVVVKTIGASGLDNVEQKGRKAASGLDAISSSSSRLGGALGTVQKALISMIGVMIAWTALITIPEAVFMGIERLIAAVIKAGEEINKATLTTAGLLASFASFGDTAEKSFTNAFNIAKKLQFTFAELAASSLASAQDIQKGFQVFVARGGLGFSDDIEKAARTAGFLVNVVVAFTGELQKERQIYTEIDALMSGQARAGAVVARLLKAQVGDLKEYLSLHKRQGDLLEDLQKRFGGIEQASARLGLTLTGMLTSIQGTATILNGMAFQSGAFPEIQRSLMGWRELLQGSVKELSTMTNMTQELSPDTESVLKSFSTFNAAVIEINIAVQGLIYSLTGVEREAEILEGVADLILRITIGVNALIAAGAMRRAATTLEEELKGAKSITVGLVEAIGTYIERADKFDAVDKRLLAGLAERYNAVHNMMIAMREGGVVDEAKVREQLMGLGNALKNAGLEESWAESIARAWDAGLANALIKVKQVMERVKRQLASEDVRNAFDRLFAGEVPKETAAEARIRRLLQEAKTYGYIQAGGATPEQILKMQDGERILASLIKGFQDRRRDILKVLDQMVEDAKAAFDKWNTELLRRRTAIREIGDTLVDALEKATRRENIFVTAEAEVNRLYREMNERLSTAKAPLWKIVELHFQWLAVAKAIRQNAVYDELIQRSGALVDTAQTAMIRMRELNEEFDYAATHGMDTSKAFEAVQRQLALLRNLVPQATEMLRQLADAESDASDVAKAKLTEAIKQMVAAFRALGLEIKAVTGYYDKLMKAMENLSNHARNDMVKIVHDGGNIVDVTKAMGEQFIVLFAEQIGGAITDLFQALMFGDDAGASMKKFIGQLLIMTGTMAVQLGIMSLIMGTIPWLAWTTNVAGAILLIAAGIAAIAAGVALGGAGGGQKTSAASSDTSGAAPEQSRTVYLNPYSTQSAQSTLLKNVSKSLDNVDDTMRRFNTKSPGVVVAEGADGARSQIITATRRGLETSHGERMMMSKVILGET